MLLHDPTGTYVEGAAEENPGCGGETVALPGRNGQEVTRSTCRISMKNMGFEMFTYLICNSPVASRARARARQ